VRFSGEKDLGDNYNCLVFLLSRAKVFEEFGVFEDDRRGSSE